MPKFYLDSDFLINLFICPKLMKIFRKIYEESEIIIPYYVKNEIFDNYSKSVLYKNKYKEFKETYDLKETPCFEIDSSEFKVFARLTTNGYFGYSKAIGKGEASCIALATKYKSYVASNNLSDIKQYAQKAKFTYITTSDLIKIANIHDKLSNSDAEKIWNTLLKNDRFMPFKTFKEFKEN